MQGKDISPISEQDRLGELGAQMANAGHSIKSLTEKDYNHLVGNYFLALDDPSVSMWGIDGDQYKPLENVHMEFIKAMESDMMAQFINLGSRGVVYTMSANKRAGYDGVLGFSVETDIHAYHLIDKNDSTLVYAYNGLIFLRMATLVKYLVCQTYRLRKVRPTIDPYAFNRILFDDDTCYNSEAIRECEKFIMDYLVT